jgi:16S rRNA (guanine527-N7)-methyltransferase
VERAAERERLSALLAGPAAAFGVDLTAVIDPLARYAALLLAWNERINLSGARDLDTLAAEHLADAFALVPHLPASGRCIDVGSGAGLPGIVLAVLRPDLSFELAEPSQKRRAFLSAVQRELGLVNVAITAARLDALARASGPPFDFAVSRAVFALGDWLEQGKALVRPGGTVAGLAGGDVSPAPGAAVHRYDVGAGPRAVLVVRK